MSRLSNVGLRPSDVAIDVGTAVVRFASHGQMSGELPAVTGGRNALAGGVIVDPDAAVAVLHPILRYARRWMGLSRVRALACAPTDATDEEKGMLADCLSQAGAAAVFISPEPLAAAIGGGVDVACNYSKVLIDIGEGVTDCAVMRSAQIVSSLAIRRGCAAIRQRIRDHLVRKYHARISDLEAEAILRGMDLWGGMTGKVEVPGLWHRRDVFAFNIPAYEIRSVIEPEVIEIISTIRMLLDDLPPSFAAETIEDGIFLSGGGALLTGMRERIACETGLEVRIVSNPLRAVVRGAREMLPIAAELRLWGR